VVVRFGSTAHFLRGLKMTIRRGNIIIYRIHLCSMLQRTISFHRCFQATAQLK